MIILTKNIVFPFVALLLFGEAGNAQERPVKSDSLFMEGRRLFAFAVKDKDEMQPALDWFEKIFAEDWNSDARASAYLGALYTLKAKHSFFPFDKLKWAKAGLSLLDKALSRAPDDIEVLFVHGTICHNLPGIFKRQDDAGRDFSKIIKLLPAHMHRYDENFIIDVLDFLNSEIALNREERRALNKINLNLSIAAGENE
jgi:hypothetical protein